MKKLFCIYLILLSSTLLLADALFTQHTIMPYMDGACSIGGGDFDGDGDTDIVATAVTGDYIAWFENDGQQNFTFHVIMENFDGARVLDVADIDGDGDKDIVVTAYEAGVIAWFNNDGAGGFTENIITDTWPTASFVYACDQRLGMDLDIDGDGDTDILATACGIGRLGWFENNGNQDFTEHILKSNWDHANSVTASDLDQDGAMDIIGTAKAGEVIWFENDGFEGFTENIIFTDWDAPNSIQAADLDDDGDIDLAITSCGNSDAVGWLENNGSQVFTLHLLKENCSGARGINISDIDADGDLDIFAIGWANPTTDAMFFENNGLAQFTEHIFCEQAYDLLKLFIIDVDDDNDLDILGSCFAADQIRWWENVDCFLIPDFQADIRSGHTPLTVTFQEDCYSRPSAVDWNWDFSDDFIIDAQGPQPTWIFTEPAYYDVRLYANNGIISETNLKEDYIRVFDGESSLEINGSSGKAECLPTMDNNLSEQFTVEAWILATDWGESSTAGGMILDKYAVKLFLCQQHNTLNDQCLILRLNTEGAPFSLIATPDMSISLEEWTHVGVSYEAEGSEAKIYLNGVQQELTYLNNPSGNIVDNSFNSIYLGNNGGESNSFCGIIDEVRLWNSVRSGDEIIQNMNSTLQGNEPELLAYWQLNEGSGTESFDLTSQGNTLLLQGVRWAQGLHLANNQQSDPELIPDVNFLHLSVFPNPFNPIAEISFNLTKREEVTLKIYNLRGQLINSLHCGELLAGTHTFFWNGTDQSGCQTGSGIYLLKLNTDGIHSSKKMLLLK